MDLSERDVHVKLQDLPPLAARPDEPATALALRLAVS